MKRKRLAAGIMSGTSLDGIDVAIAYIKGINHQTKINQIAAKTYPYPQDILESIKKAVENKMDVREVSNLNFELAKLYSNCVLDLCKSINIKSSDLYFVASHGQTVYHQGKYDGEFMPSTLQLGSGPVMSQLLETTIVSDFRASDMAQGGQGAPLVPFVDYLLYQDKNKSRILQNIGGISNITILPNKKENKNVYAFDTGPGNMMINHAMEVLYQKPYDDKGKIAFSGQLIKPLYDEIINHEYLNIKPPKSCGREQFGVSYTDKLLEKYKDNSKNNLVHTITKASADSMIKAIKDYVLVSHHIDELIVAGGGAHNDFIMNELKLQLSPIKVLTTNDLKMDSDFKEALAFIILGNQAIHKKHATIKETTGAKKTVITGSISFFK